jgi:predicted metal-dependent HD superfamily phosphohydrolase
VRDEYADIPDETFWRGCKEILRGFLARPSVFATSGFRERYEERARENLAWTIAHH